LTSPNMRARASFVEHIRLGWRDPRITSLPVTNLIHRATGAEDAWIEEATGRIGDWRALTRSVYLRWAITINASELAEQRYRSMPTDQALWTRTLRVMADGSPQQVPLAVWSAPDAADHYAQTTPLIAGYAVTDLFEALEDVIFELYEIMLRHNPGPIIRGEEFRPLRRMWRQRNSSPEAEEDWRKAWVDRYEHWRRKKAYDGLHAVLRAFFEHAGLRRPSAYHRTDVSDWCRTLEMIGELRHLVIHGGAVVSNKLGRLSNTPTSLTFDFVPGAELDVKLHHLQSVECFCDQLLTTINLSLVEKAIDGPLPAYKPADLVQDQ
jgi:hypothetical protein